MAKKKKIWNWGRFPVVKDANIKTVSSEAEIHHLQSHSIPVSIRGNGRSYGDSSLHQNMIEGLGFSKIFELDASGVLHCGAGFLIGEVLERVVPLGYFIPVTPGTKLVSVGGAVAADIHGKNHHKEGNISAHIEALTILTENGDPVVCTPKDNPDLFWATCGGMGLTGFILSVKIKLKKIESSYIKQKALKLKNLEETIDAIHKNLDATYSVAWIDTLKKGKKLGRSILLLGEHAALSDLSTKQQKKPLMVTTKKTINVPFTMPGFVLGKLSMRIFNFLYYNKQIKRVKNNTLHYEPYFYPLDVIGKWNRIYGKRGFTQYQFVLPPENSKEGMRVILEKLAKEGVASLLSVLKAFGDERRQNYIAFPMKGLNLALDIKFSESSVRLLQELDDLVLSYGGRVYLAKDARMHKTFFESTYPDLPAFKDVLKTYNSKQLFGSWQSQRLGLTKTSEKTNESIFMDTLLVLGANSDIAFACAKHFATNGFRIIMAGHNLEPIDKKAQIIRESLKAVVDVVSFDARALESHQAFYDNLDVKPSVVLCAFGVLPDEDIARTSVGVSKDSVYVNYLGAVSILNVVAEDFKNRGQGSILGISSVAGDRGRGSNYIYGSAKAGFSAYLSGLRNFYLKHKVFVSTIKPGFVKTKMIGDLKTPGPLTASPEQVANACFKAYKRKRNVVYVKAIWRPIMWTIRHVPEFIFKKLSL